MLSWVCSVLPQWPALGLLSSGLCVPDSDPGCSGLAEGGEFWSWQSSWPIHERRREVASEHLLMSGLSVGHTSRRKGILHNLPSSPLSRAHLCSAEPLFPEDSDVLSPPDSLCSRTWQTAAISPSCDKCHIYLTQNVAKTCVYLDPTQGYNTTSLTLLSSPVNLHE